MNAPVVMDPRHPHDGAGQLGDAEKQVPILGSIRHGTFPPDLLNQTTAQQIEVREVIDRVENLRAPLRLEQRAPAHGRILVDVVLVRIQQVGFGLGRDRGHHGGECFGAEFVIVVQQPDKLSAGHGQGVVGVGGDAAVGRCFDPNPRVPAGRLAQQGQVFAVLGIGHDHAEFPARIRLHLDRADRPSQEVRLHPVNREQNADQRSGWFIRGLIASARILRSRLLGMNPVRILRGLGPLDWIGLLRRGVPTRPGGKKAT